MPRRLSEQAPASEAGTLHTAISSGSCSAGDGSLVSAERQKKSRLDVACHDLRQPLQTLVLLQAMLARAVDGGEATSLVARMGAALNALTVIVHDLADEPSSKTSGPEVRQSPSEVLAAGNLPPQRFPQSEIAGAPASTVFVVDDDAAVRDAIAEVLEVEGHAVHKFDSSEAFLMSDNHSADGCLLVDAYLPGMSGLELLRAIQAGGYVMPAIMITGNSDVPIAVQAMKAGAVDFIEKPIGRDELLASITRALEQSRDKHKLLCWQQDAASQISGLTARQHEIMEMVLAGHPSKNIAADLGISQRTVENHRASIMKRTGAKSLPALARLAVAAAAAAPDATQQTDSSAPSRVMALPAV